MARSATRPRPSGRNTGRGRHHSRRKLRARAIWFLVCAAAAVAFGLVVGSMS